MNLINLPYNVVIWAVGSVIIPIFGIRSYISYRKLKSPLSLYFTISGLTVSLCWALWSWPFALLSNNPEAHSLTFLLVTFGDLFLFISLFLQTRVFWYLTLQDSVRYIYIGAPTLLVAVTGFTSLVGVGLANPGLPIIIDNRALFHTSSVSYICQLILLVFVLLVGIALAKRAALQKTLKQKSGSMAIASLYVAAAIGGGANILSGRPDNTSVLTTTAYALGLFLFLAIFIVLRLVDKK